MDLLLGVQGRGAHVAAGAAAGRPAHLMCGRAKVAARTEDERLIRWPEDLLRPDRAVGAVGRRASSSFVALSNVRAAILSSGLWSRRLSPLALSRTRYRRMG